jgi:hypothetical protein
MATRVRKTAASSSAADAAGSALRGLMKTMERNRVRRLRAAGFDESTATYLSDLHTPNLMWAQRRGWRILEVCDRW